MASFYVSAAMISPTDITDVQPGLRFLMTDEARSEGETFLRHLKRICWTYRPEGKPAWVEYGLIGILPERFPHFHRADQVLGGLISDAFRHVARHTDMPRTWAWIAGCVAEGYPHKLRPTCEAILAWSRPGKNTSYEEERSDRAWKVAEVAITRQRYARQWNDRDISDDIADEEAGLRPAVVDLPKSTGDIVDEMPF